MENTHLIVTIRYRNHRGETALRRIIPKVIRFSFSQWHPEIQWLLDAVDIDRNADRTFAMKDILEWGVVNEPAAA